MRSILGLSVALVLSACTNRPEGPPQDCAEARAGFYDCSDRFQTKTNGVVTTDFEGMWYACVPHSEPKVFEGSWATDFEWNAFFQNARPSPKEAFPDYLPPALSFKEGVERPASVDGQARLWAIKFVGREETCELLPDMPPTFFVEKILEKELIWEVQGYPYLKFD